MKSLNRTPLYETNLNLGARMIEFSGWEMPIQFSGLINEHNSVRNNCGIFDISHMGVFLINGNNPKDALQKLVPSDLHRIGPKEACYTVLLNEAGGIIDDLIIYDLGNNNQNKESLLLIINAGCIEKDIQWLKENCLEQDLTISDNKKNMVLIAIQGPESTSKLSKVLGKSFLDIPKFGHQEIIINIKESQKQTPIFIARTGYTGEDGYEILLEKTAGIVLWKEFIQHGATPCGLGARDTLRLEATLPLYGNDLNQTTTPFEAGLGWIVHLEKPIEFIGKKALEKQATNGIQRKLIALKIEGKAIARKGYPVINQNQTIGEITSGSWSPTLNAGIALAYVPIEMAKLGTKLNIKIRNKLHSATVVKKPFYRRVS